jgi:glutamate/aspartate transport system substrate-binding protein
VKLHALALLLAAGAALAQSEDTPLELTGTLAKVRAASAITIAYRESSVPFSYLSARNEPIGYSIELCRKLAEAIGEAVGRELALKWLAVTSETRIEAIASGRADLECGSTTNNLERQKQVAFSPIIFVAGTKLLVKRGSPIRSYRNLAGKTVVVTAGTTNEKAMQEIARRFKIDFQIVKQKDHSQSYAQVESGNADAFA